MATIVKPSSPGWQRVVPRYRKVKSRHVSPFSLQAQTQIWDGAAWQFDLYLPPMTATEAADWLTFVYNLARNNDNFSLVVTGYVPAAVSSPMLVRLIGSQVSWDISEIKRYGLSFSVEEDQ